SVEDAIANGIVVDDGKTPRNRLQIGTLLHAIEENGFTAAFGGARRDEEKARAKERVYSHRDDFGQWDPKNQRPNYGRCITAACMRASICGSSRCPTGPSWTSGTTLLKKTSKSLPSTLPTSVTSSIVTDSCCRCRNTCSPVATSRSRTARCVSVRSAI